MRRYALGDALKSGDGTCDIAVAGVEISEERLAAGVAFSFPTLRGGYRIMVNAEDISTNYWLFLDAFEWCAAVLAGQRGLLRSRGGMCGQKFPLGWHVGSATVSKKCPLWAGMCGQQQ